MVRRRDHAVARLQKVNSSAAATRAYIDSSHPRYSVLDLHSEE
jgi:hypothetical protein